MSIKEKIFQKKWIFLAIIPLTLFLLFTYKTTRSSTQKSIEPNTSSFYQTWIKIVPKEASFSIFFPKKPLFEETQKRIPRSSKTILYKEFSLKEDAFYSLSYTDLPTSWVKWGSSLVLKGALKQLLITYKGSLLQKTKALYQEHPSLHYEIKKETSHIVGRLILADKTLYKIEIEHPSEEEGRKIFQNFSPTFKLQN